MAALAMAGADGSESDFDIDIADDLIPGMEDSAPVATLKATKSMLGFEDGSSSGSSSEEGETSQPRGDALAPPELGLLAAASAASAAVASAAVAVEDGKEASPASAAAEPSMTAVKSGEVKGDPAVSTTAAAATRDLAEAPLPPSAEVLVPAASSANVEAAPIVRSETPPSQLPEEAEAPLPPPATAPTSSHSSEADASRVEARHPLESSAQVTSLPSDLPEADLFTSVAPAASAASEVAKVVKEVKESQKVMEAEPPAVAVDIPAAETPAPREAEPLATQELLPEAKVVEAGALVSAASTVAASNETSRETATSTAMAAASREDSIDEIARNEAPVGEPPNDLKGAESDSSDCEKAWEEIAEKTAELAKNAREAQGVAAAKQDLLSTPISYKEVTQWLLQLEINKEALLEFREMVEDEAPIPCGCFKRSRPRSDVPGLEKKLWPEKDLVLFLKVTHFDFNDTVHHRMLRTIYSKLSRNKVCPTIGRHWEVLGFQGGDPRTDLNRSGGVLNVLQMFYFFSHHFDLLKAAYLLAQDVQQNYPLACVSINITKMIIEALLAGKLSKLCNAGSKGVFDTCCQMHSAALYHYYWRWRTQKRSIEHTELTFNEVKTLLFRRPAKLLEMLEQGIAEAKAKSDPSRLEFTELDFGAARPKAQATSSLPTRLWQYQARE